MHVLHTPAELQFVHEFMVHEKQLVPVFDGRNPILQV